MKALFMEWGFPSSARLHSLPEKNLKDTHFVSSYPSAFI